MRRRVVLTAAAIKDLAALDKQTARRIAARLETLAAEDAVSAPRLRNLGAGYGAVYKLRVGDYRALFRIEEGDIIVDIVSHRSNVYKVLRRRADDG